MFANWLNYPNWLRNRGLIIWSLFYLIFSHQTNNLFWSLTSITAVPRYNYSIPSRYTSLLLMPIPSCTTSFVKLLPCRRSPRRMNFFNECDSVVSPVKPSDVWHPSSPLCLNHSWWTIWACRTVSGTPSLNRLSRFELPLVIKNDFASELNQFLATFYERQYKDLPSMTYLYVPKDAANKTVEEIIQDKALVARFEGAG